MNSICEGLQILINEKFKDQQECRKFVLSAFIVVCATHGFCSIVCYCHLGGEKKPSFKENFIKAVKERVITHTKELSDENPIKSLAQQYIKMNTVQETVSRIRSWIPFLRQ